MEDDWRLTVVECATASLFARAVSDALPLGYIDARLCYQLTVAIRAASRGDWAIRRREASGLRGPPRASQLPILALRRRKRRSLIRRTSRCLRCGRAGEAVGRAGPAPAIRSFRRDPGGDSTRQRSGHRGVQLRRQQGWRGALAVVMLTAGSPAEAIVGSCWDRDARSSAKRIATRGFYSCLHGGGGGVLRVVLRPFFGHAYGDARLYSCLLGGGLKRSWDRIASAERAIKVMMRGTASAPSPDKTPSPADRRGNFDDDFRLQNGYVTPVDCECVWLMHCRFAICACV